MYNDKRLKPIRQKLRNDSTRAEGLLWSKLKGKQLGVKVRRQYSVGNFVLDFYAPKLRLGIEIDGDTHGFPKIMKKDILKEKCISAQDITLLRFTNADIYENLPNVLEAVLAKIGEMCGN